jgi:hypothetical protein
VQPDAGDREFRRRTESFQARVVPGAVLRLTLCDALQILSGRHVIHTGIYMPFAQGTALRLHLNYTLLPKYLKGLGYSTHMVGK